MQKERCLLGCLNQIKLSCRKVFIRHLRIFVSIGTANEREKIRRSRITNFRDDRPLFSNGKAFTLIELLVVVLIIGILAAVALPQYQKAVIKARAAQLYAAVNAIATAAHSYELANGEWPDNFEALDIDLPLEDKTGTACGLAVGTGITKKEGKDYAVVIGQKANTWGDIFGVFTSGNYNCTGFAYLTTADGSFDGQTLYCVERETLTRGVFCNKVMGKTFVQNYYGWNYFE